MEVIKLKYMDLSRISLTLGKDIEYYNIIKKKLTPSEYPYDQSVASMVKHFEIQYELLWKYICRYIDTKYHILYEAPRPIFQECFKRGICTPGETRLLLFIIDIYHLCTHLDNIPIPEEVTVHISAYYELIGTLLPRIAPNTLTL